MPKKSEPTELIPRGLSKRQAAAYIGISVTFFDTLVKDGRMPKAKLINTRKVWDRWALDYAFDELPEEGGQEEPNPWH